MPFVKENLLREVKTSPLISENENFPSRINEIFNDSAPNILDFVTRKIREDKDTKSVKVGKGNAKYVCVT